jgi:hypothetical protein
MRKRREAYGDLDLIGIHVIPVLVQLEDGRPVVAD